MIRRCVQIAAFGLLVYLLVGVSFPPGHVFDPNSLSDAETLPVELFLWLDPLVGVSAVIAARIVAIAIVASAAVILLCIIMPRVFCGWICPMGALIDAFDWLVGRWTRPIHQRPGRWWTRARYGVLGVVIGASLFGVMLAGFVAPLVVLTRGSVFTIGRVQGGAARGWETLTPAGWAVWISAGILAGTLLVGLLGRRFWCRVLCPSGALLSLASGGRIYERRVNSNCTGCGKCVDTCAFGAVNDDFTTRHGACAFCRTCSAICPAEAISFANRLSSPGGKPARTGRRAAIAAMLVGAGAGGAVKWALAHQGARKQSRFIRPPGSVAEEQFLALCVQCGQCVQVCPGPVLHPAGLDAGLDALWTPIVIPTHAACHPDCNFCTQVCPTGAIQPLSLEQKRSFVMGVAKIDTSICLPHCGAEDCRLCYDECTAAGYDAIEMREIKLDIGDIDEGAFSDMERDAMSKIEAPFITDKCVGCGLCEYRCHSQRVINTKSLPRSAIIVHPPETNR
ncbi:MAG: 4Fe-4S binding protein [Phycisphaerae bacterium]|jgi:ferredoxin|nr:4Fe-4S binding protein [Phycisphaerae bacterium]